MKTRPLRALGALLVITALCTAPARGDTFLIDDTTVGTVYDGILDGFPLPPPGIPPDGAGDFVNNSLAVALQTGVSEERGIAEFPLATLAGLTSADIDTATLTFNIDDVISTFGPGTAFDGTAAATIVLFRYAGNGAIDLSDFGNVVGAPLAIIDTTPLGVITDATLAATGPLQFEVDVTAALSALLDSGATHLGIVFTTNDAGSATSLDNLGLGSAGPPGVGGAAMPFLTVVTLPDEPPLWLKPQLRCQKAIGKGGAKVGSTLHKALGKCFDAVLSAVSKGQALATVAAKCAADLDQANPNSKVAKAIAKLGEAVTDACQGLDPSEVGSPCDAGATTIAAVATCVVNQHQVKVGEMVAAEYADSCALITAVGLAPNFPALCGP